MIYLVFGLLLLGSCSLPTKQVKVIKSDTPIKVLPLSLDDGDVIACDNLTCKVVTKQ